MLAALRPPALRVWLAALVLSPLTPASAQASTWATLRGEACQVRSHASDLAADVLARCERAVPVVTAFWPAWGRRVTVVVASDLAELARLLPGSGDLTDVAALATDTVFVNPSAYVGLTAAGRQVVLTHEVTHVATHRVQGVPTWLVEGFAEQVANADGAIPLAVAAQELAAQVRAGHVPAALPGDAELGATDVASHYEQAWRAVDLLARAYGRQTLARFYRSGGDFAVLGTTREAFTDAWRADLRRTLS